MRGNKFEKSHIHILESETLSRESRVTEIAQEIVDSIPYYLRTIDLSLPYVKTYTLLLTRCILQERGKFAEGCLTVKNWWGLLGDCLTVKN